MTHGPRVGLAMAVLAIATSLPQSLAAQVAEPRTCASASCTHDSDAHVAPLPEFAGDAPTLLLSILEGSLRTEPMQALEAGRALLAHPRLSPALRLRAEVGMGWVWLVLGQAERAQQLATRCLSKAAGHAGVADALPAAHALVIRALLRRGLFVDALAHARRAAAKHGLESEELRTAHAAALYRNRHLAEAAQLYRKVLASDPLHVEALVRLGSGLQDARPAPIDDGLRAAILEQERGNRSGARRRLFGVLSRRAEHPIALRILGELEIQDERMANPLVASGFFRRHFEDLDVSTVPAYLRRFFPDYDRLSAARQLVVRVAARPFGRDLQRVLQKGGLHDLLGAGERTTDAPSRAWLRGKRTFDGRVWDDVRGIGGLCAATGVEALDEALEGGFQTLVHELAHQLHFHALSPEDCETIERLYRQAKREGRFLDYYAASNAAEYFGQGFEAWFSLVKAPAQPITHGHTRFELERSDPALAAFIARIARFDPLRAGGTALAERCFEAALRAARPQDAAALLEFLGGRERRPEMGRELDVLRARLKHSPRG